MKIACLFLQAEKRWRGGLGGLRFLAWSEAAGSNSPAALIARSPKRLWSRQMTHGRTQTETLHRGGADTTSPVASDRRSQRLDRL